MLVYFMWTEFLSISINIVQEYCTNMFESGQNNTVTPLLYHITPGFKAKIAYPISTKKNKREEACKKFTFLSLTSSC